MGSTLMKGSRAMRSNRGSKIRGQRQLGMESLESRRCLAVTAVVTSGNLVVSGDAAGDVQITADVATDGTVTYDVTDAGQSIAAGLAVTKGIKVNLDATSGADNNVTLNLNGQSVDAVMVKLGDGDNSFTVQGGTINKGLTYTGGADGDAVTIAADATVKQTVQANLGQGDNAITVNGTVSRDLLVRAGGGDDT